MHWPLRYNWSNVENGLKHHTINQPIFKEKMLCLFCISLWHVDPLSFISILTLLWPFLKVPFTSMVAASIDERSDCTKHAGWSLIYTVSFNNSLWTKANMILQLLGSWLNPKCLVGLFGILRVKTLPLNNNLWYWGKGLFPPCFFSYDRQIYYF